MRLRSRCSIFKILPIDGTILVKIFLAIFLSVVLPAGMANAQFNQYTPPGGPQEHPQTREERLKLEIEAARYHLGPVRISPEVGIKDVAYVRNLFESGTTAPADVTATVGAGARGYLRTGPKVVWVGRVLPEYVWWRQRKDSRNLNVSYGLEGLGFFNHFFLGAAAERNEGQAILTPEVPELASSRDDRLQATAEVRFTGALSSFATVSQNQQKGLVDNLDDRLLGEVSFLDRTEQVLRGGVRWRPQRGWTLGLGAERSQVDFERRERDSSNSGTAPVLEVLVDRNRFFFQLDAAARSLETRDGSRFVPFDGVTGNIGLSIRPKRTIEVWTYGSRNLVYSLSPSYAYLDDRRAGMSVVLTTGRRLVTRVYAERGTNEYAAFSPAAPGRSDQVRSFGGSLRFLVTELLMVSAQVTRSHFDSNLPGDDRTFTSGGLSVRLGGSF